jgi:hypothetical protein
MSGKGDKWRKTDFKKYHENLDAINFKKKKQTPSTVEVIKQKGKTTYKYN